MSSSYATGPAGGTRVVRRRTARPGLRLPRRPGEPPRVAGQPASRVEVLDPGPPHVGPALGRPRRRGPGLQLRTTPGARAGCGPRTARPARSRRSAPCSSRTPSRRRGRHRVTCIARVRARGPRARSRGRPRASPRSWSATTSGAPPGPRPTVRGRADQGLIRHLSRGEDVRGGAPYPVLSVPSLLAPGPGEPALRAHREGPTGGQRSAQIVPTTRAAGGQGGQCGQRNDAVTQLPAGCRGPQRHPVPASGDTARCPRRQHRLTSSPLRGLAPPPAPATLDEECRRRADRRRLSP